MAGGGKFLISVTPHNYENVLSSLNAQGADTSAAVKKTMTMVATFVQDIVAAQFQNAALRSGDAFPGAYTLHLLAKLGTTEASSKQISPYTFTVAYDFGELGLKEDLEAGYHYGASLAGGGQVDLPWHGSEGSLKNDIEVRYEFWQALRYHLTYRGRPLPPDLWGDTISARLAVWSALDVAPQWLLLQYGQQEWEPTNDPFPIVENTREAIRVIGRTFFIQNLFESYRELLGDIGSNNLLSNYSNPTSAKLSEGLGYYTEAATTSNLNLKQNKLAVIYGNYLNQMLNAKSNDSVRYLIGEMSGLAGVELTTLLETMRRRGR